MSSEMEDCNGQNGCCQKVMLERTKGAKVEKQVVGFSGKRKGA